MADEEFSASTSSSSHLPPTRELPALGGFEEPVYEERVVRSPGSPLRRRADEEEEQHNADVDVIVEDAGSITLLPAPVYDSQQQQQASEGDVAMGMTGNGSVNLGSPDPAASRGGPGPSAGWGLWKIACRMRVWEVRNRYPPGLIRALVAQEADDYFAARGIPHPDASLFMEEEYYDWELDSEGEGDLDGEGEDDADADADGDVDGDADSFALHQPQTPPDSGMTIGMGGVQSSFYATPAFPPPPLATVRVPMLRHLFTDIAIEPPVLGSGRGTPVDRGRWACWGGRQMMMAMEGLGPAIGTGRLESRVPQYLGMGREAYGDGPAEVSTTPTPMPMPVEEQQQQQMGMPFQPDEAVWQQFLQSVGVEGGVPPAAVDAMDVDTAAATQDDHAQGTSGGVALGLGHSPPAECLLPARYGCPDGPVCGSDESLARQDEQGLDRMYFESGSLRRTTSGLG